MNILKFPLARVTLLFIIGIVVADFYKPNLAILFIAISIGFILLIAHYLYFKNKIGNHNFFGFTILFNSLICGMIGYSLHIEEQSPDNYSHFIEVSHLQDVQLSISEVIKSSAKYDRFVANVRKIDKREVTGKLLLNIKRDSIISKLEVGDVLNIRARLFKNKQLSHDFQFDYGKYLSRKNIYAQVFCEKNAIEPTGEIQKSLPFYASKIRSKILKNLRAQNFNERELQVLNALILGQQQNIEADIVKDYQYAGAVHVLSVSGLHVGLIVLFLNFLFRNIYNTRLGNLFKLVATLLSLISFAILAGLSPPVVRAVTMFCFVAIGMYIRRSSNIFNTLLISMLLILFFEPNYLFDVGFQLSYLALFFIVWFQPILKDLYTPKYKIVQYFWDIITVSFAAQIGTMPLSLYYFHQFPTLFFITNIVILPALSIIMLIGIVVMILAYFNIQISFLSTLLERSIYWVNLIISKIASYEKFVIKDISLNIWMMLALFLVIVSFILFLQFKKYKYVVALGSSVVVFQLVFLFFKIKNESSEEVVFFEHKNYIVISEKLGRNVNIYSNFEDSITGLEYDLKNYLWYNFSSIDKIQPIYNFQYLAGKKIFVLNSPLQVTLPVNPDIVFVTNSPKINFDRFININKPKLVIVDVNNFKYLQKKWKETCIKNKIPFHMMSEKGLYILK